jgi:hypothetical protein
MRRQANRTEEWRIIVASLGCGSVRLRYTPIERSHHGSLWVGGGRRGRVLRRSILGTAASQSARAVRQADATSKRGHHASPRAGRAMAGPRPRSPAPAHADGRADRHRCPRTGSTSPPVSMPRLLATLRTDAVDVLGLPEKPFTSYCSRTTPGPSPYTFWSCAMFWSDIPIALPAISLRGENFWEKSRSYCTLFCHRHDKCDNYLSGMGSSGI